MHDLNELIPTRQSLLSRLKDWNDQESWKLFFDTYWRLIYNTAIGAGLTGAEAQDVVQETVVSVLKSMPGFEHHGGAGHFKVWLLRLTRWRIADQLRKRERQPQRTDESFSGSAGRGMRRCLRGPEEIPRPEFCAGGNSNPTRSSTRPSARFCSWTRITCRWSTPSFCSTPPIPSQRSRLLARLQPREK